MPTRSAGSRQLDALVLLSASVALFAGLGSPRLWDPPELEVGPVGARGSQRRAGSAVCKASRTGVCGLRFDRRRLRLIAHAARAIGRARTDLDLAPGRHTVIDRHPLRIDASWTRGMHAVYAGLFEANDVWQSLGPAVGDRIFLGELRID